MGESITDALLRSNAEPLGDITSFNGAGIYAIYYSGIFDGYGPIAERNLDKRFELPIYVGKAVPPGARKGNFGLDADPGTAVYSRLNQHAKSVDEAKNLNLADFYCQLLVVDDIWIPLAESLLIATFSPVWNKLIDGFGNHDPGKGRYNQTRSRWDTLHPGRAWALRCRERPETSQQITAELEAHLRDMLV